MEYNPWYSTKESSPRVCSPLHSITIKNSATIDDEIQITTSVDTQ